MATKSILITAGPTWVPIDNVRVISNKASAETGLLLAGIFIKLGARVTLLLGPVGACCINSKVKVIPYRYFDELEYKLLREIKSKKHQVIIHSAAVSDYRPEKQWKNKIKSGIRKLRLNLVPTAKLIDRIKKIDSSLFLVGFKYIPNSKKEALLDESFVLMRHANANLVVANTIKGCRYKAYIVRPQGEFSQAMSKKELTKRLAELIMEKK